MDERVDEGGSTEYKKKKNIYIKDRVRKDRVLSILVWTTVFLVTQLRGVESSRTTGFTATDLWDHLAYIEPII
jgi:hypothetical protein